MVDLEQRFNGTTGQAARRVAYHYILGHTPSLRRTLLASAPLWQSALAVPNSYLFALLIRRALSIRPEVVGRDMVRLEREFDFVAERLGCRRLDESALHNCTTASIIDSESKRSGSAEVASRTRTETPESGSNSSSGSRSPTTSAESLKHAKSSESLASSVGKKPFGGEVFPSADEWSMQDCRWSQPTKRFIVGEHFTAADLTFAALAGPALLIGVRKSIANSMHKRQIRSNPIRSDPASPLAPHRSLADKGRERWFHPWVGPRVSPNEKSGIAV